MKHAESDEVEIEGRQLRFSNRDKLLWPQAGFTKGELIDYYLAIGPVLLPHVAGRPMTLRRFPDGVEGQNWFQTQCPSGRPDWIPTHSLAAHSGRIFELCLINDLPSLAWVANLAAIELHPLLARADRPGEPLVAVFDLDPGPSADVVDCCEVAIELRRLLEGFGLSSFAKTSGSVGLHVYVPLNSAHTFSQTKEFARRAARLLAAASPERITDTRGSSRGSKVLIDWSQNAENRSTIAAYSMRGTGWPTVSTPVTWEEIEQAFSERRPELLLFEPADVLSRHEHMGDVFRLALDRMQALP